MLKKAHTQYGASTSTWRRWAHRMAIALLAIIMVMTSHPPYLAAQGEHSDPGQNREPVPTLEEQLPSWAAEDILLLRKAGIVKGYSDGSFGPDRHVTRAEMVSWLIRMNVVIDAISANQADRSQDQDLTIDPVSFTDITEEWFAEEVRQAALLGLVSGYLDGTFKPNDSLNRYEASSMLNRLLQWQSDSEKGFADDDKFPAWAASHVYALKEAGVISGYPDGTFGGEGTITRAEAAVMLGRSMKLAQKRDFLVLDDEGKPLTGASVRIHPQGAYTPIHQAETNDQGRFSLRTEAGELKEGRYDLVIAEGDQIAQEVLVVKPYHLHREEQVIRAARGATLTGQVLDKDGKPAADKLLAFRTNPVFITLTDAQGRFSAQVLPDRTYELTLLASAELQQWAEAADDRDKGIRDPEFWQSYVHWFDSSAADLKGCDCEIIDSDKSYLAPLAGQSKDIGVWRLGGSGGGAGPGSGSGGGGNQPPVDPEEPPVDPEEPPVDPELPPDPVTVSKPLPIAGSPPFMETVDFLFQGDRPIQTGLEEDTLISDMVSVVRGKVLDRAGDPLPGVSITVLNEERYGSTLSRADGQFDLAVNGGTSVTLQYSKKDYMTVQRVVHVMFNTYQTAPDVVLNEYDSKVTQVMLNSHQELQAAQGREVTDADGTRQATLIIPGNTSAEMIMADGSRVPMPQMNFRATEYTVGEEGAASMPGELPSFVGYTYAVELSADEAVQAGAREVRFNQPLYLYVDNFLQFPAGEVVPIGYYDRELGKWIPSDNGRVIAIVADEDGVAAVDVDGDGLADDFAVLAELGFNEAELMKLSELYEPGQSFWRSPIEHFTPYDCNWPYGPPEDAVNPPDREPNRNRPEEDDPCRAQGSIIGCQDQSLGQRIPLPGTGMSLNYTSKRTEGYKESNILDIPVTHDSLPASVDKVVLTIEIAGKVWRESFDPKPHINYQFEWDGKDVYDRLLNNETLYKVSIGYEYPMVYYSSPDGFARSFGRLSGERGARIGVTRMIPRVTTVRSWSGTLAIPRNPFQEVGIAGWSLDQQHVMDRSTQNVYTGDGRKLSSSLRDYSISDAYRVPGRPDGSILVDFGPDGQMFLLDNFENDGVRKQRILTVDRDGQARHVSDLPPIEGFNSINHLRVGRDGSLYVVEAHSWITRVKIWRKAPGGEWEHIAGSGEYRNGGYQDVEDGAVPTESILDFMNDIEIGDDGTVYFVSRHILYKIDGDGLIARLGGGLSVQGVEEGEMTPRNVGRVDEFEVGPDGSLYVLDTISFRRITPEGKISLIAKSGGWGGVSISDGSHITDQLSFVTLHFEMDDYGNIYFFNRTGNTGLYKLATNGVFYHIGLLYEDEFSLSENDLQQVSPGGELYIYYFGGLPITLNSGRLHRLSPSINGKHASRIVDHNGQFLYAFDPLTGLVESVNHTINGTSLYTFQYDADGRVAEIVDTYGNKVTVERNAEGVPTAIVSDTGPRILLTVENGQLTGVSVPGAGSYAMTYDEQGLMTAFTGPDGYESQYVYDEHGRLTSAWNSELGEQTLQMDKFTDGYRITHTKPGDQFYTYEVRRDENGVIRKRNTNPGGAVIVSEVRPDGSQEIHYPDGSTITKEFAPDPRFGMRAPILTRFEQQTAGGSTMKYSESREVVLSDPDDSLSVVEWTVTNTINGNSSTVHYDAATGTYTETSAEGNVTITRMDEHGRTIEREEQGLDPMVFSYDGKGRLLALAQGDQRLSYVYDEDAGRITVTDAEGSSKQYQYNELGLFTSVTHDEGNTYGKAFNESGKLTSLTMPDGTVHQVGYDSLGRLTEYAPFSATGGVKREYSDSGALSQVMLPGSRSLSYSHDGGGRVTAMNDEISRTFAYADTSDRVSRMVSESEGRLQDISYTYDGGRMTGAVWTGAANGEFAYEYNPTSNLTRITMTLPDAGQTPLYADLDIAWNRDAQLIRQGPFTFARGAAGGRVDSLADERMEIAVEYDSSGRERERIYSLDGATVYQETLSYNARGLLSGKTVITSGGVTTHGYEYDGNGQLLRAQRSGDGGTLEEVYAYDDNRNRISRQLNGAAAQTAEYGAYDRLESLNDLTYQYDSAGYLTTRGSDTFRYGTHGELLQAQVDAETITYTYDALGRRVSREDAAGVTSYLYGNPLAPLIPTVEVAPDGQQTIYHYDEDGLLLALERGGQRYYVITDRVGTPAMIVDEEGIAVKELRYDSYGVKQFDSNEGFKLSIGFAGGLEDAKTGLTRFGVRDYEASSGRWTAIDPMLYDSGQGNLYAYVNNNPVQLRDPCGLFCIGASAYAGAGGGVQVCMSSDGMSVCGELGFGAGAGLEMNPFQDLADNGFALEASAGIGMGPVGLNVGYEISRFNDCFQHGKTGGADLGPLTVDFTDPANTGLQTIGLDSFLDPSFGAEAKLAGKACGQWNW